MKRPDRICAATLRKISRQALMLLGAFCVIIEAHADELVPKSSNVAALKPGERLHLISALESGAVIEPGGWSMQRTEWATADRAIGAKVGHEAIVFRGLAEQAGKGDFRIASEVPGQTRAIGCWVYLAEGANVREVGFQIDDQEGESLLHLEPANQAGWRWVEASLETTAWKQAWPQSNKNGSPNMPLRSVRLIWWSKGSGPSEVTVDGAVARILVPNETPPGRLHAELLGASKISRNGSCRGSLLVSNLGEQAMTLGVELELQRDGKLYSERLPDPVHGSDLALEARSWAIAGGKRIAESTLTDGLDYTAAETDYRTGFWDFAEEFVELDKAREITAMGWRSGDANWIWKTDVSASLDGESFASVPELQGVDLHSRWGEQVFPAFKPFRAKVIRLRYHRDSAKMDVVRMPAAIRLWDGPDDESFEMPKAGEPLDRVALQRKVGGRSFEVVNFEFRPELPTGQYLVAGRIRAGNATTLLTRHVFVEPQLLADVGPDSRFGVNGALSQLAHEHRQLGIGWVRFENFKWPMVSPSAHQYAFDGSVPPWHVHLDQIIEDYRSAGLHVLPMMFLTPQWASGADGKTPGEMAHSQPPRDHADFGEFAFQSAARFGSSKVDTALLKTTDRRNGLNQISHFELGNEPNLNPLRDPARPPTWGAWAGTMNEWWEMWRHGAEALKRADPNAVVLSPGFAGATSETVDALRLHQYADGKRPLDFVDVLSVHYYSGRTPPEIALGDVNNGQGYDVTFVEHLKRLAEWRDRHKPGTPIWMTETGYDTDGPIGTNEWVQAARLPRVVALCLANGVEKVFVYRESGSTPTQHAAAGLLRNDLSRRPSWHTYATLIRQLHRAEPGRRLPHDDANVWLQTWRRNGKTILMANAITGRAKLRLRLGAATVTDAFGGVTQVDDTHDLELIEFPCHLSDFTDEAALAPLSERAKQRDEKRLSQRERDSKRTAYLFNFGDAKEPAALDFGGLRYFQVVPAARLYDQASGFGFVSLPAVKNDHRHWMATPIERDAVQLAEGHVFQCDVSPGKYELRINASPLHGAGEMILVGADGGDIALEFAAGQSEKLTRPLTISNQSVRLRAAAPMLLRWLVLEQLTDQ